MKRGMSLGVWICGVLGLKANRCMAVACLFALVGLTRSGLAQTTWTNVSPSEVITGVWSDNANWNNGKPGAVIAYLTNSVNSYVVNYNTTDTGYNGGSLYMNQAALSPTNVTLNINATMGSTASRNKLVGMGYRAIVNVNNGGTWNVRLGDATYHTYGYLNVFDGGSVNMSYQNRNQTKRMKIFVDSGGVFDGEYAITPGGILTVEQGGLYTGRSLSIGDRWQAGTAAVTNRGSFVTTRDTQVGPSMQTVDRYAFFSMEGGVARIGTEGGIYGLGISYCADGLWYNTGAGGPSSFVMSGGVVTNNVLQVGYSEMTQTSSYSRTADGTLNIQDGSFWNLKHALIGGFPTTIAAGSVDNAANNLRGTVTQSGGAFRSLSHVYVANGPSTGTLNLSGGTFTVSDGGAATLYLGANEGANVNLIGKGTINLTGGHLTMDRLVAKNGALNSMINFSAGTMEILDYAEVGAGTTVTVGDGVADARLILGGSEVDRLILDEGSEPETVVQLGSGSRIDIDESAVFQQNFDAMTLEFWFKPTLIDPAGWHIMIHRHNVGGADVGNSVWYAGLQNGFLIVTFNARNADSAWDDGKTTFKPEVGTWYHVAGVWDGNQGQVYLDGELIHTYDSNPMTGNGPGAMAFGDQVGGGRPYQGLLSDVRLWDQTRTAQQIDDSHLSRLNGDENGLIGYWPLNEGSGTTASDLTASGNDGTLSATAAWLTELSAFAFADGVTINTNATLAVGGSGMIGAATVAGDVTLRKDARLAWDFNATTQDSLTVSGAVALPDSVNVELTSLDGSTPRSIPLLSASGGITGSTADWPLVEMAGASYSAVIDGNTLLMMLPRGTLISIR